jgi:hypothetical protein
LFLASSEREIEGLENEQFERTTSGNGGNGGRHVFIRDDRTGVDGIIDDDGRNQDIWSNSIDRDGSIRRRDGYYYASGHFCACGACATARAEYDPEDAR